MYLLQLLTFSILFIARMGVDIMQTAAIAVINEILVISGPQLRQIYGGHCGASLDICLSKLDYLMPCRSSILSARAASIRSLSRRSRPSRIRFEEGGVALVVLSLAYSKGPHYDQFIALLGEQSEQAKLACRRTSSSVSLGVRRMRRVFSAATPRLTTRARGALPRPTQRQWPM